MKKFLSLVLALVMTMSLVTVSAGAKDFTDSTKIQYAEAVDVMSAVKVIDGYAEGDFRPSTTLTRGAAAKIICNLILGPTTASALVADAAPYKDVPTNHTFAGYIAYCQKEGIISGYADGTFRPANSLTGYAFMKMLLGALGYKAEQEGYTGANWSIQVAKRALNIGLADDLVGDFNGVKAVTREEACLYAFNTLKATMVEYDKNSTVTVGNITIKEQSDAKEMANTAKNETIKDDHKMQFAEKYFTDLKLNSKAHDDFMRPANQWKVKAEEIGTYAQTPDATYTAKVKSTDIYKDLALGSAIEKKDVEIYVDGVENDSAAPIAIRKGSDTKVGVSGNGVLTEVFYDDDADTITITQVNTYVGTIVKTVKATDKKDAYVVVSPETALDGSTGFTGNKNFETNEKFDDDAYVLYTYSKDANEIKSVALATKVEGTVTRAENDKENIKDAKALTIGDTKYKDSQKVAGDKLGDISVDESYTVYLDAYGYMIYVERVDEIGDYALLVEAQGGGRFQDKKAVLVFADGTSKLVDTKKDYTDPENLDMVDAHGKDVTTGSTNFTIVTYKVDSDKVYTLRAVSSKQGEKDYNVTTEVADADSAADFKLTSDKAGIKVNGDTVTANSASQFVVREASNDDILAGDDWDAYTGIKNAPDITAAANTNLNNKTQYNNVSAYYYCKDGKMVTIMFIVPAADVDVNGSINKQIFFADDASNLIHDKAGDYFEYTAIVNGEIKTVKVDENVKADKAAKNLSGELFKSYTVDKDGFITKLTSYNNSEVYGTDKEEGVINAAKGIAKTSKEYTVKIAGETITVDENAKIFYVNTDDEISESSYNGIAQDDTARVYAYVEDYMVKTLIIYEQESNDGPKNMAVSLDKTGTQTTTVGTELVVTATATSDNSNAVGYQWYKKTGTVKFDSKTGKVEGATKIAGATDKAFTAPTDAVSSGDTYFCVVEFYNSKLDQETAYAKSAGVTVEVNAAPEATMDIQVCYKLADGTVVATELLEGQKAESGKSYVTVEANDKAYGNAYTLVGAGLIRVPFAADTLTNVEFTVKAK